MKSVSFLLVDDLEENLLSLEALLRRDDLVLLKARSGDQALEMLLKEDDIALALVDVQMPGLDGFELAELMRGSERTRRIPIIFLTAGSTDGRRRFRGYEAGAVDFLQKPIEPDILRSKTEVFFQLHRQKQQLAEQRDELKAYAEALSEAGRRKDEHLVTLAHDLSQNETMRAQQDVLLREINHRIKNLFSLTSGLITLSARTAASVDELADDLRERLDALARAHELTLPDLSGGTNVAPTDTSVVALLRAILAPHEHDQESRITISGADVPISSGTLTSFALLLHELATNAAKYGALATRDGRLTVTVSEIGDDLRMEWIEQATTAPRSSPGGREGFGRTLERSVLRSLAGTLMREWNERGLVLTLTLPRSRFAGG